MKLYHGTSDLHWERIKTEGLVPRSSSGPSNWSHSIESNPDTIYLTSGYAMYFALNAIDYDIPKKHFAVVIEIDTDDLAPDALVPDEDALEQALRVSRVDRAEMLARTSNYRDNVCQWSSMGYGWEWSLDVLGTCGHIGPIPASAFSRVAIIDIREEQDLTWTMMDVSVSVANHRFLKDRNSNIHRAIFGDPPLVADGSNLEFPVPTITGNGVRIINLKELRNV